MTAMLDTPDPAIMAAIQPHPLDPPLADPPPPRAGIQSVEVGYGLLAALGAAPGPLMLRDLAAAAGMNAAKAHRYLVSFQRLGLVVQDLASNRYDLGPAALKLGLASISRLDSVKLARQRLPDLMSRIGHTLALAVWGNQGPTIVHWEESPRAITVSLRLGDVMPLLSSATGLCFSAFMAPGGASAERAHPKIEPAASKSPVVSKRRVRVMLEERAIGAQPYSRISCSAATRPVFRSRRRACLE